MAYTIAKNREKNERFDKTHRNSGKNGTKRSY